jgi:hypothetical protein
MSSLPSGAGRYLATTQEPLLSLLEVSIADEAGETIMVRKLHLANTAYTSLDSD